MSGSQSRPDDFDEAADHYWPYEGGRNYRPAFWMLDYESLDAEPSQDDERPESKDPEQQSEDA